MNHGKPRSAYSVLAMLLFVLSLAALIVVLAGCKQDNSRPPNDTDVVRAPASSPCRCTVRPTLETVR